MFTAIQYYVTVRCHTCAEFSPVRTVFSVVPLECEEAVAHGHRRLVVAAADSNDTASRAYVVMATGDWITYTV